MTALDRVAGVAIAVRATGSLPTDRNTAPPTNFRMPYRIQLLATVGFVDCGTRYDAVGDCRRFGSEI